MSSSSHGNHSTPKSQKVNYQVQRKRSICSLWCLIISLVFPLGCSPNDQPELGQVTGTIKLDGQPVVGIDVVFQPESGRPARGRTDAEGKYELTYIRNTKGTKVGPNRVEIAPSEDGVVEDESEGTDEESKTATKRPVSGKPKIPARYNTNSELKVDVKSGNNVLDFDMES